MNKESYTAASVFPTKLLHQKVIKDGKIIPIHPQIYITNKCNLNCSFCSCSDRQKTLEMKFDEVQEVIDILADRGAKAITFSGGGEPLLHPKINEIINYADKKNIEAGLVSNGVVLDKLQYHNNLTWCRISSDDNRIPSYDSISKAINNNPKTDWAFSHVVSANPNYQIIGSVINFANLHDFTHIRLVSDLFDLDNVPSMEEVKQNLKRVNDSKVIYQGRKDSTKGTKDCYISLLKPVISPEGVFPCCGSQYAIQGQNRDMVERMKMGNIKDLADILDEQKHFDGSKCTTCYYSQYNQALTKLKNVPKHLNFV